MKKSVFLFAAALWLGGLEVQAQNQSTSMTMKPDKEGRISKVVFYNQADTLKGTLKAIALKNGYITKYVIKKSALSTVQLSAEQIAQIKVHRIFKRWAFSVTVQHPDGQTAQHWPTYLAGNDLMLGVLKENVTEEVDEDVAATFELQTFCWKYKGESVVIDEEFLSQNLKRWEQELGMSLDMLPSDAYNKEKLVKLTEMIESKLSTWTAW